MDGGALDPDAAAIAAKMAAASLPPISERGIEAVRLMMETMARPAGPDMDSVEDLELPGPHGLLKVKLYRPIPGGGLPIVVFFHGGGMVMGSVDSYDHVARQLAQSCRAIVASVDYRLAPEHKYPVATEEAFFATQWIADNAEMLGGDERRVAVAGDSAGGCLAAATCLMARDRGGPQLLAQLLIYPGVDRDYGLPSMSQFSDGPVLNLPDIVWMKDAYLGTGDGPDPAYGVPANCDDLSGLPDAIVVTAGVDPIRDGVERYGARLRDAGVQTALLRYPGVYHGFFSQCHLLSRGRAALAEVGGLMQAKFETAATEDPVAAETGGSAAR